MGVFKSILLIVYFVPFGIVSGQFRIVGLLNDNSKVDKHQAPVYQTNAQGRGFSIDDGLKEFLIRPKDIIRVHVIDDLNQNDQISQSDNIFMLRRKRPTVQRTTETTVINYKTIAITEKPTKSGKFRTYFHLFFSLFLFKERISLQMEKNLSFSFLSYFFLQKNAEKLMEQTKRPAHIQQQRNIWQPNSNKYALHKLDNVISNAVHRSSTIQKQSKHQKSMKRNMYKSRCRCEPISNCPRMQISVTRCPPNEFMCCF